MDHSRASNYYVKIDNAYELITDDSVGLFPHITYKKWRNSINPMFYESKYVEEIGWWGANMDIESFYAKHHDNSNLKTLYELTYRYIVDGNTTNDSSYDIDDLYRINVVNKKNSNYNLVAFSNIHGTQNYIENNINAIAFSSDAFPLS